jgi:hypothetical protein
VFYEVTNYFFEIDQADPPGGYMKTLVAIERHIIKAVWRICTNG